MEKNVSYFAGFPIKKDCSTLEIGHFMLYPVVYVYPLGVLAFQDKKNIFKIQLKLGITDVKGPTNFICY